MDNLAIINRVLEEHRTIRGHIKLVGDSIVDREALLNLRKTRADWVPGQLEDMLEKQNKLQQTMAALDEGLRGHFDFEEKALPPLLGELFMRALVLDHQEIKKEIENAKSIVVNTRLEGLSRDELLAKEADIQKVVDSMSRKIEEHAAREEIILEMLQRALEEKEQNKSE